MKQLLDAVSVIHDKDIIHRNITPHNIVFKQDNILSLRIINFESALYIGGSEEIESHCNSMLKDLNTHEFLEMRNRLLNHERVHLYGGNFH